MPTTFDYGYPLWVQIFWEIQPLIHESHSCDDLGTKIIEVFLKGSSDSTQD